MRPAHERSVEELESVLKRVARRYAEGQIEQVRFVTFANTIEDALRQLVEMEEVEA